MNIFSRFLTSRYFYFIVAAIAIVMIGITVNSFLPKRKATENQGGGLTGLFGLSNLFDSKNNEILSIDQTIEKQIVVNQDVANWEKKVGARYVWRRKLPLTSDKYFIYFDLTRKAFIGRLYPDNDDLNAQIQAEAIRILKKEIGIPLESFTVDWDVYPRSSFE